MNIVVVVVVVVVVVYLRYSGCGGMPGAGGCRNTSTLAIQ